MCFQFVYNKVNRKERKKKKKNIDSQLCISISSFNAIINFPEFQTLDQNGKQERQKIKKKML